MCTAAAFPLRETGKEGPESSKRRDGGDGDMGEIRGVCVHEHPLAHCSSEHPPSLATVLALASGTAEETPFQ